MDIVATVARNASADGLGVRQKRHFVRNPLVLTPACLVSGILHLMWKRPMPNWSAQAPN
ncbi:MAG: hypothetical protein ACYTE3_16140 [Planctomycetota bacterium]